MALRHGDQERYPGTCGRCMQPLELGWVHEDAATCVAQLQRELMQLRSLLAVREMLLRSAQETAALQREPEALARHEAILFPDRTH